MTEEIKFYLYIQINRKDSFFVSSTNLVKKIHRLSYSFLSVTLSCKDFLLNLSKDLIACRSFSYSFLYLLCLFLITSYLTLLPIDNPHAVAVDIGLAIKRILPKDSY